MVSPAEDWNELKRGFERGDDSIIVQEVEFYEDDSVRSVASADGESVNAWSVELYYGYGRHQSILVFDDPRSAWEVAKLLTYYIDSAGADILSMDILEEHGEDRDLTPGSFVSDKSPREALDALLGYNSQQLAIALGEKEFQPHP